MEVKFNKTHEMAILPKRNNDAGELGDVGHDIFATHHITIPPKSSVKVKSGLQLADISPGYWFKIEARSGLGFKQDIIPFAGVIDNPYRGEIGIKLFNFSNVEVDIPYGKACCQMIVYKMEDVKISFSNNVTETVRGQNGFGSSDR